MSITTGFGNYFTKLLLEKLLGKTDFTPPTTWYVALLTTDPSDDDGTSLVEVTTGGFGTYARQPGTNNTTTFPASSTVSHVQTLVSGIDFDFGTNSGGSGVTIVGIALYDASTSGNLGPWGPLTVSKAVGNGDAFKILAGNITFTMS